MYVEFKYKNVNLNLPRGSNVRLLNEWIPVFLY